MHEQLSGLPATSFWLTWYGFSSCGRGRRPVTIGHPGVGDDAIGTRATAASDRLPARSATCVALIPVGIACWAPAAAERVRAVQPEFERSRLPQDAARCCRQRSRPTVWPAIGPRCLKGLGSSNSAITWRVPSARQPFMTGTGGMFDKLQTERRD